MTALLLLLLLLLQVVTKEFDEPWQQWQSCPSFYSIHVDLCDFEYRHENNMNIIIEFRGIRSMMEEKDWLEVTVDYAASDTDYTNLIWVALLNNSRKPN